MLTVPNLLSLMRIPLAFLFLQDNALYRAVAIGLALISDGLDGYYARKLKQISAVGAWLDPISDKLFVAVVLAVFFSEGRIEAWQVVTFLCRDLAILLFAIYLLCCGRLASYQVRAIWCGKIATVLQLVTLAVLTVGFTMPSPFYLLFILLGLLALLELYLRKDPSGFYRSSTQ
jgi:CDP-diacylglycerol--glycerol-3-phosphate 3-phosphatidyltransferase